MGTTNVGGSAGSSRNSSLPLSDFLFGLGKLILLAAFSTSLINLSIEVASWLNGQGGNPLDALGPFMLSVSVVIFQVGSMIRSEEMGDSNGGH